MSIPREPVNGPGATGRQDAPARGEVWLDGRVVPADSAHLAITDRGFQLGDGIFESMRARRGVVIELEEHLVRLHESAAVLAIPLPWEDRTIVGGIADLLAARGLDGAGLGGSPIGDAAIRVTVSRGPLELRGLLPPGWRDTRPTILAQAWPHHPLPATVLENGIRAIASTIRHDPASPLAGVKSTSRADHVYAKLEADRAGADDALFLTVDGAISEATTSNIFALVRGSFVTPPRSAGILAGTTRTWLLAHSEAVEPAIRIIEADLMPDDLLRADEAFVSSSVAGIVPLVAYEGRPIGTGRPGPRTIALRAARERWIDERSLEGLPGPAGVPVR